MPIAMQSVIASAAGAADHHHSIHQPLVRIPLRLGKWGSFGVSAAVHTHMTHLPLTDHA